MDEEKKIQVEKSETTSKKAFLGGMWGVIGVIIGIILLCTVCSFSSVIFTALGIASSVDKAPVKLDETHSATETPTPAQSFKLKDKIQLSDFTIETFSLVDGGKISGYFQPGKGNKAVSVDVKITGTGESQYITSGDFKLKDSDDYEYDASYSLEKSPSFSSRNIGKGDNIRGWITFETPTKAKGFKLIFTPNSFDDQHVIIELQ